MSIVQICENILPLYKKKTGQIRKQKVTQGPQVKSTHHEKANFVGSLYKQTKGTLIVN